MGISLPGIPEKSAKQNIIKINVFTESPAHEKAFSIFSLALARVGVPQVTNACARTFFIAGESAAVTIHIHFLLNQGVVNGFSGNK